MSSCTHEQEQNGVTVAVLFCLHIGHTEEDAKLSDCSQRHSSAAPSQDGGTDSRQRLSIWVLHRWTTCLLLDQSTGLILDLPPFLPQVLC